MRRTLLIAVLALLASPAWADIFKCTDSSGHVTYSNVQTKGCTRLNLEPLTTAPPPRPAAKAPSPAGFPKVDEGAQKARDSDRRKILEQELASEQKALAEARKSLADAQEAQPTDRFVGSGGRPGGINQARIDERTQPLRDQIQLHERNIEAINKEINGLR